MTKFPAKPYSSKTIPSRFAFGQQLSPAEERVYNLLVNEGLSNLEIAQRISRSIKTVKYHKRVIFQKKGVRCSLHLIIQHYQKLLEAA